jgi:hypothetical protein
MKTVKFVPHLTCLYATGVPDTMRKDIPHEQMLFNCDVEFAKEKGGPITRHILKTMEANSAFQIGLKPSFHNWLIDVKVMLLSKGEFAQPPGWHCDGVLKDRFTGQPDLTTLDIAIPHYMAVIGAPEARNTIEYIVQNITIPIDEERVWRSINNYADFFYHKLDTEQLKDNWMHIYTQPTINRVMPAAQNGWVMFFKCFSSVNAPKNQLRQQVQVYAPVYDQHT